MSRQCVPAIGISQGAPPGADQGSARGACTRLRHGARAQERAAVAMLLRARASLQAAVAAFVDARAERAGDAAAAQPRLHALARRIAAAFGAPEAPRAEAELIKLADMRDNHIFKGLAALAAPGVSLDEATKHTKARPMPPACGSRAPNAAPNLLEQEVGRLVTGLHVACGPESCACWRGCSARQARRFHAQCWSHGFFQALLLQHTRCASAAALHPMLVACRC